MKKYLSFILLIGVIMNSASAHAFLKFAWEPSPGGVEGYKLYWGTIQGIHPYSIDVGDVTEYPMDLLPLDPGVSYYFVVTACAGLMESDPSNEIHWRFEWDALPLLSSVLDFLKYNADDPNGYSMETGDPGENSFTGVLTSFFSVTGDWDEDGIPDIGIFLDDAWYLDMDGDGEWDPHVDEVIPESSFGLASTKNGDLDEEESTATIIQDEDE